MKREYFFQKIDNVLVVYQEKRQFVRSAKGMMARRLAHDCFRKANIMQKGIAESLIQAIFARRIKGKLTKRNKEKAWQFFKKNCPEFAQE